MKKSILIIAALFAAFTVNAKDITINLSQAAAVAFGGCSATPAVADDVLTVNYSPGAWQWAGVEFTLENLAEVPVISYEYKGDGAEEFGEDGIVLFVYLRDSEGNRWIKDEYWPNLQNTEWQTESITPDKALDWDAQTYPITKNPFISLGFIANPGSAYNGSFQLKNIKLTVSDDQSAIENTSVSIKAMKVVRDGQVLFIRDGKTFNALGAEVR